MTSSQSPEKKKQVNFLKLGILPFDYSEKPCKNTCYGSSVRSSFMKSLGLRMGQQRRRFYVA